MTENAPEPTKRWKLSKTQTLTLIAVVSLYVGVVIVDPDVTGAVATHTVTQLIALLLILGGLACFFWAGHRAIKARRPIELRERLERNAERRRRREARRLKKQGGTAAAE